MSKLPKRLRPGRLGVSTWCQRFGTKRLARLGDIERSGKPAKYDDSTDKRVLGLLDEAPPKGYSQWNGRLLAEALPDISKDQVWRILRRHDICLERRRSCGPSVQVRNSAPRRPTLLACTST